MTDLAQFAEDLARDAANANEPELATIAKLLSETTKLRRAAVDCTRQREQIERVTQLKRHERDMKRGKSH